MKVLAITQARVSSSRLPSKVLLPLGSETVLDLHLKRLKKTKLVGDILVATTLEEGAEQIVTIAKRNSVLCYRGSLEDVLDRFYQAASSQEPDIVVRITSDCPMIDPFYIDDLIEKFIDANVDYASNCLVPNLPDGMDAEVMRYSVLERAWKEAQLQSEREHITPYIWKNTDVKGGALFKGLAVDYGLNLQAVRLTLDQPEDYEVLKALVASLGESASLQEMLNFLLLNPEISKLNSKISMNEGYFKSLQKDGRK